MRVVELKRNRPDHFCRGGRMISAFRQLTEGEGEHRPEDWLASTTTTMFGRQRDGLSIVGDRVLRDWVTEEPEAWLGPEHVGLFGPQVALLVKLRAVFQLAGHPRVWRALRSVKLQMDRVRRLSLPEPHTLDQLGEHGPDRRRHRGG